jgi:sialic acid synthase SpsE
MENRIAAKLSPQVFIIAEMACSHDGSLEHAKTIVRAAGDTGADAVQLQIWKAAELVVPSHPDLPKLRKLELAESDWEELVAFTRKHYPELEIIACVYDRRAVDVARHLGIDVYKLHANELTNHSLLQHAARSARRIDLCIGASRLDEIQTAVEFLRGNGSQEIWLMYGFQSFPTPVHEVHLEFLRKLGQLFELPIGYQDHSDAEEETAFWIPAAAVGMGISILEKHVTHDRSQRGADHQAALNPDEFARFVGMVRMLESARGSSLPRAFSAAQERYRREGTRTLVASRDLPPGVPLEEGDLFALRTVERGLSIGEIEGTLGRTLTRAIPAYSPIRREDLR